MASFRNDYGVLAHPRLLDALSANGMNVEIPYGEDIHSQNAERMILDLFGCPKGKVHFLAGGTQTNLVALSSMLRFPYECVVAASSGHINVHETGAIEGGGHKVVTVPAENGKVSVGKLREIVAYHCDEHMVLPKAVYISDSTEIGTVYTKEELLGLRKACDELGLYLYLDGARLGAALTSSENDVTPKLLSEVCDAFSIGGTKNGFLFGEALVVVNQSLQENLRFLIKNKGAMLAKGYAVGIQFEEALNGGNDSLYFCLAKESNRIAGLLLKGLKGLGLKVADSPTNQLFVELPSPLALSIQEIFGCEIWERKGETTVVRFVTSFASEEKDVDEVLGYLRARL